MFQFALKEASRTSQDASKLKSESHMQPYRTSDCSVTVSTGVISASEGIFIVDSSLLSSLFIIQQYSVHSVIVEFKRILIKCE